jgi:beta-lactamase regulating signal transducer with metallopeptidase domain
MNADELLRLACTQSWQLAALVAVVAAAVSTLARNRPHLAHALWLVVLLKCFCPPLWSTPSGVFCWLQWADVEEQEVLHSASSAGTRLVPLPDRNATSFDEASPDLIAPSDHAPVVADSAVTFAAAQKRGEQAGLSLSHWLIVLWLLGAAASLAWLSAQWLCFAARLRRSPVCDYPEVAARFAQLARTLRVGRRVRLRVTDSRIGPAVIGLWRPTVLLPAIILEGKSPRELEPILAHELIHIRRGDLWLSLAQALARSLWWFHLPLRWALGLVQRETERCCDEEVLAELRCQPAAYARSLLEVLDRKRWLYPAPAVPGVRPVEITSRRLERIMKLGHGGHRNTPWWCRAVLLMLAALVLPGGALVTAGDEPKPPSPPASTSAANDTDEESPKQTASAKRASEEPFVAPMESDRLTLRDEFYTVEIPPLAYIGEGEAGIRVVGGPWHIVFGEKQRRLYAKSGRLIAPHVTSRAEDRMIELSDIQLTFDKLQAIAEHARLQGSKLELRGKVCCLHPGIVLRTERMELTAGRIRANGHVQLRYTFGGSYQQILAERLDWDLERRNLKILNQHEELNLQWKEPPQSVGGFLRNPPPISEKSADRDRSLVYPVTYNVADLVVPVPAGFIDLAESPVAVKQPDPPKADFQPLVDRIQATVSPASWAGAGGVGSIAPFATNLSLVVSQTQEVHEQITELLEQLRRRQDIQVCLEVHTIRLDDDRFWERSDTGIGLKPDEARRLSAAQLTTHQASALLEAAQSDRRTSLRQLPKPTLMNHQQVDLHLPPRSAGGQPVRLKLVSSVSEDNRKVRLQLSDADRAAEYQIPDGESLLINLTEPTEKVGVPLLRTLPEVGRLFEASATSANQQRVFLLLTAKILIQEEEEELLLRRRERQKN